MNSAIRRLRHLRAKQLWHKAPTQIGVNVKVQVDPKVGQVWEHDTLRNYKIKVLAVVDRHIDVECIESDLSEVLVGDIHALEEDVLQKYYSICIKPLYGERCTKCKRDYPHALKQANFVCWGCKNGA